MDDKQGTAVLRLPMFGWGFSVECQVTHILQALWSVRVLPSVMPSVHKWQGDSVYRTMTRSGDFTETLPKGVGDWQQQKWQNRNSNYVAILKAFVCCYEAFESAFSCPCMRPSVLLIHCLTQVQPIMSHTLLATNVLRKVCNFKRDEHKGKE